MPSCKTCVPVVETIEKEKIVEVHTRDTATRDIKKGEEMTIDYGYDVYEFAKLHNIDVDSVNRLVTNQDGKYGR